MVKRLLFITRNFPPQIGGLERLSYFLYHHLSRHFNIILLKWSGNKRWLFLVLPYFITKSIFLILSKKVDIIYLSDGFLSLLIPILKPLRIPIIITIHGLDITYNNLIYQLLIPKCIFLADRIIVVSRATRKECIKRGIPQNKIEIINNGIKDIFFLNKDKEVLKEKLKREYKLNIAKEKILLTVGRLIARKGIDWFLEEVIPYLKEKNDNFIYFIVGNGPLYRKITAIIKNKGLGSNVYLLGKVGDELLKLLYNVADVFIMPNREVKGDLEGFGIVALEAASCKLPIVASDIEGIRDALLNGKTGMLLPSKDKVRFAEAILKILYNKKLATEMGQRARELTIENFSWAKIIEKYKAVLEKRI